MNEAEKFIAVIEKIRAMESESELMAYAEEMEKKKKEFSLFHIRLIMYAFYLKGKAYAE